MIGSERASVHVRAGAWVNDADRAALKNLDGVAVGDQTELQRLRARVAELEEEREILKERRPGSPRKARTMPRRSGS
jgi:hypothetical protein